MDILRVSRQQIKLIPLRSYHWQTSVERGWEQPDSRHGVTGLLENFADRDTGRGRGCPPTFHSRLTAVN